MNSKIKISVVILMLAVAYVVLAQSTMEIRNNGGSTASSTITYKKAVEQGMGSTVIERKNDGMTTASTTYTFDASGKTVAMRLHETTIADANVATGVLYFYWDQTSLGIRHKYKTATGTIYTYFASYSQP